MMELKAGNRVKIKARSDWPLPTGYKLANAEGEVFEAVKEVKGYFLVLLDKDLTGIDTRIPLGFRGDALEKI